VPKRHVKKPVLKIALAQTDPAIGAFRDNADTMASLCARARADGCQLIVFPELSITGYPPRDLLERKDFVQGALAAQETLLQEVQGIGVLCGNITLNTSGVGKPLYNSAILFENGQLLHVVHKQLLPSYDVFDETRYFKPGPPSRPVDFHGLNLGITICEDIWNEPEFCPFCETYETDPVNDLADKGASFFINISASPFSLGKPETRSRIIRGLARKFHSPFIYCNSAGGQDCLVFDGGSFGMKPDGEIFLQAGDFCQDFVVAETENFSGEIKKVSVSQEERIFKALVLALRDYTKRCGIKKVTLGLSGGIDSSLTACLAVEAMGTENVLGVLMPSPYTSSDSLEDAEALAQNLGIKKVTLPISQIFDSYIRTLEGIFSGIPMDVTEENIQARIRGNLLMAISNKLGYMVLSTGNKSELAVGYCTLYGDMSGGYALISDLPKTMVYKVSRFANREKPLIPERVFDKPPSAELRPGQKDEDDLPPYEVLDPILELYLERRLTPQEIIDRGYPSEVVKKIIRMVDANEYKRIQAPLGPKVTAKAFSCGRRYPVAHGFRSV